VILEVIRDHVFRGLGLLPGDISPDVVDRFINRVYTREIVTRVSGRSDNTEHVFDLVDGQREYDFRDDIDSADLIISTRGPFHVLDKVAGTNYRQLAYYTDHEEYWRSHDDTLTGIPRTVLAQENSLILLPVPTATEVAAYTIRGYFNSFRADLTAGNDVRQEEAWAVINGATNHLADDIGDDDIAQRFAAKYRDSLAELSQKQSTKTTSYPAQGDAW
jgi:hypothetical protein